MKIIVVHKDNLTKLQKDIFEALKSKNSSVKEVWKNTLKKEDINESDIVISIGGDGTALSASHYILDQPLIAVNSSPKTSVGALTRIKIEEIPDKIEEIKKGKETIEKLERIDIKINNKIIEEKALNEVFIASEKAYHISKYIIEYKNKKEEQRSSGVIVTTGTGSTAWFKSSGGTPFSPQSKFIKMIVREPYSTHITSFSILEETINENESFKITPLVDSLIALDSIREHKISPRDKVEISISQHPLNMVL